MFYGLTYINMVLALIAIYMTIMLPIKYAVTRRWSVYIVYSLTILVGLLLVHWASLLKEPGVWQHRLVSTIIIVSKIYFAHCLKYSSIRKK